MVPRIITAAVLALLSNVGSGSRAALLTQLWPPQIMSAVPSIAGMRVMGRKPHKNFLLSAKRP